MWRRGKKDGTSLKQYAHIGRNQINNLDLPLIDTLANITSATSRTMLGGIKHPSGQSIATTLPCLDPFETLLAPGEFFCTINDYPILGIPLLELHLEHASLLKYFTTTMQLYESKHNWMADCFGLYPLISNLMINDPFNKHCAGRCMITFTAIR